MIDISLQVVEGELVGRKNDLGDAVDKNDKDFEQVLPVRGPADRGLARPARQGTTAGNDVRSQLGDAPSPAVRRLRTTRR